MKEKLKDILHLIDTDYNIRLYNRYGKFMTMTRSNSLSINDDFLDAEVIKIYPMHDAEESYQCIQLFCN